MKRIILAIALVLVCLSVYAAPILYTYLTTTPNSGSPVNGSTIEYMNGQWIFVPYGGGGSNFLPIQFFTNDQGQVCLQIGIPITNALLNAPILSNTMVGVPGSGIQIAYLSNAPIWMVSNKIEMDYLTDRVGLNYFNLVATNSGSETVDLEFDNGTMFLAGTETIGSGGNFDLLPVPALSVLYNNGSQVVQGTAFNGSNNLVLSGANTWANIATLLSSVGSGPGVLTNSSSSSTPILSWTQVGGGRGTFNGSPDLGYNGGNGTNVIQATNFTAHGTTTNLVTAPASPGAATVNIVSNTSAFAEPLMSVATVATTSQSMLASNVMKFPTLSAGTNQTSCTVFYVLIMDTTDASQHEITYINGSFTATNTAGGIGIQTPTSPPSWRPGNAPPTGITPTINSSGQWAILGQDPSNVKTTYVMLATQVDDHAQ